MTNTGLFSPGLVLLSSHTHKLRRRLSPRFFHTHTHTHVHLTTVRPSHTHAHTDAHAHTRTLTHPHTRTRTHARTHMGPRMGQEDIGCLERTGLGLAWRAAVSRAASCRAPRCGAWRSRRRCRRACRACAPGSRPASSHTHARKENAMRTPSPYKGMGWFANISLACPRRPELTSTSSSSAANNS